MSHHYKRLDVAAVDTRDRSLPDRGALLDTPPLAVCGGDGSTVDGVFDWYYGFD